MKDAIKKTYGKKGEAIVNMNLAAVDAGVANVHKVDVPAAWADAPDDAPAPKMVGRDQAVSYTHLFRMIPHRHETVLKAFFPAVFFSAQISDDYRLEKSSIFLNKIFNCLRIFLL